MLRAILVCCLGVPADKDRECNGSLPYNKAEYSPDPQDDMLARRILTTMFEARKTGEDLRTQVSDVVEVTNWTESLAQALLTHLANGLKQGIVMKEGPLKEAFDKATAAAAEFAKEHPVWTTVIALGILVELLPWVVEALGFAELGPIAGELWSLYLSYLFFQCPREELSSNHEAFVRNLCVLVAGEVCWVRAKGEPVRVLPATWHDLEALLAGLGCVCRGGETWNDRWEVGMLDTATGTGVGGGGGGGGRRAGHVK